MATEIDFEFKKNNSSANWLIPFVKGWGDVITKYAQFHSKDPDGPYYYNERANLSLLAAGIWKAGGVALEEFSSEKGRGTKKSSGRVDLYFSSRATNAELEAKQKWMIAGCSDKRLTSAVRDSLALAIGDARKDYGAEKKYGCVFFVPRFPKEDFPKYKKTPDDYIRQELERYLKASGADLWAWCFPKANRKLTVAERKSYYPGVIMAIASPR